MKKIPKLLALLLIAGTIFVGCGSDPIIPDPPIAVTGVTLNESALALTVGDIETLTATVQPRDADNQNVTWSSSSPNVATVANGLITAVAPGTATITVTTADGGRTATCEVTVTLSGVGAPTATTDPGIVISGIRWATRNVNAPGTFADNPEDAGMFFQWNRRQGWAATGTVTGWDNSNAAGATWEATNDPCPQGWRVPTQQELQSLNNAGNVWTNQNGVNGRIFGTAPNQIFLPAAGFRNTTGALLDAGRWGYYWSSTWGGMNPATAWYLQINSGFTSMSNIGRANGFSVRCVAE